MKHYIRPKIKILLTCCIVNTKQWLYSVGGNKKNKFLIKYNNKTKLLALFAACIFSFGLSSNAFAYSCNSIFKEADGLIKKLRLWLLVKLIRELKLC